VKITESTVVKLSITEVEGLDAIKVFLEDFKLGQGDLTIKYYGASWSSYWGAMGEESLVDFLLSANTDYITNKLFPSSMLRWVIDYDEISEKIGCDVNEHSLLLYEDKMDEAYEGDWRLELPKKENHEWAYLYRIVDVVREALRVYRDGSCYNRVHTTAARDAGH